MRPKLASGSENPAIPRAVFSGAPAIRSPVDRLAPIGCGPSKKNSGRILSRTWGKACERFDAGRPGRRFHTGRAFAGAESGLPPDYPGADCPASGDRVDLLSE